jgi:hypothetical protein
MMPNRSVAQTRQIDVDTATLLWGVLFGAVGMGFFIYGKKQKSVIPFICGLMLMIFPYFVSNVWALVVIGGGLMAVPYFVRW